MLTIDIPAVGGQTSIQAALNLLRVHDVRGLLVRHGRSTVKLHMNLELLEAAANGLTTCRQLVGGRPVEVRATVSSAEPELRMMAQLSIADQGSDVVRLTAISDAIGQDIQSGAKVCACSGNPAHILACPPDWEGQQCPGLDGIVHCY